MGREGARWGLKEDFRWVSNARLGGLRLGARITVRPGWAAD